MSSTLLLAALLAQHEHHDHHAMMEEEGAAPPSLAAVETDRVASGTAWLPAAPHNGWHLGAGSWQLMFHGLLFGGYDWQAAPRPRGDRALSAVGWVMGMARRDGASNSLVFRVM